MRSKRSFYVDVHLRILIIYSAFLLGKFNARVMDYTFRNTVIKFSPNLRSTTIAGAYLINERHKSRNKDDGLPGYRATSESYLKDNFNLAPHSSPRPRIPRLKMTIFSRILHTRYLTLSYYPTFGRAHETPKSVTEDLKPEDCKSRSTRRAPNNSTLLPRAHPSCPFFFRTG